MGIKEKDVGPHGGHGTTLEHRHQALGPGCAPTHLPRAEPAVTLPPRASCSTSSSGLRLRRRAPPRPARPVCLLSAPVSQHKWTDFKSDQIMGC